MEPALTNIGIVLPEPGYLDGVRELTRRHGTLLINDETHTFCAGPGGATAAWGLEPDIVTMGKAIGGGIPAAAYGLTAELADRLLGRRDLTWWTWAGSAAPWPATRCRSPRCGPRWREVLTDEAFGEMIERWPSGSPPASDGVISRHGLPWSVSQLGARAEYRFAPRRPAPAARPRPPPIPSSTSTCTSTWSTGAS